VGLVTNEMVEERAPATRGCGVSSEACSFWVTRRALSGHVLQGLYALRMARLGRDVIYGKVGSVGSDSASERASMGLRRPGVSILQRLV